MIQSGDAFGEQKIVGYLIKKPTDTSYVLVSFMPKLQGIFVMLKSTALAPGRIKPEMIFVPQSGFMQS